MIFFMFVYVLLFNIDVSFAEETNNVSSIVSDIVREFKEQTDQWYDKLKTVATDLFFVVILFEFVWTSMKAALQQMETKDYLINFTMIIVSGIFFLAVINNYQEWSQDVVMGVQKRNKHAAVYFCVTKYCEFRRRSCTFGSHSVLGDGCGRHKMADPSSCFE